MSKKERSHYWVIVVSLVFMGSSVLASSVNWIGSGDGVSWSDPHNWNGSVVPPSGSDVTIGVVASNPTIQFTSAAGTVQINSLTTSQPMNLSGGTLQIATSLQTSQNLTLAGGTIKNCTVTAMGGAGLTATSGTLNGVTLGSDLTVQGSLIVTNGMTLNNANLMIGGDYGDDYNGYAYFHGSQTLGGTGQVIFAGTSQNYLYAQGDGTLAGAAVLTIGSGILVHGPQGGYVEGYYSYDSIINQGTINADTSGATITLSGAAVTNNGTMQAADGGSLNVTNLVDAAGLSISGGGTLTLNGNWVNSGSLTATGSTLTLGGTWSNTGSINVPETELNLGGTFTVASLGTLNGDGGTVNVTGTLDNTGNTLVLNAATGSWNLSGGTILNGTVTAADGAVLTASSGTLNGVTLGCNLTVQGSLNVKDGLTLNNANLIIGDDSGYSYNYVYFQGAQTLGGTGQVIFAGAYGQNYLYAQGDGTLAGAATLTIGGGILVHGPQGGYVEGEYSYDSIINRGTINADSSGVTLTVSSSNAMFTNSGTLEATSGTLNLSAAVTNGNQGVIAGAPSGTISVYSNLLGSTTNAAGWNPIGAVTFAGSGTASSPQLLEVMGQDDGASAGGYQSNFVYGQLALSSGTYVRLVDQFQNATSGANAIYASTLSVPAGSTLDLNGFHLYTQASNIAGTVLNGAVTLVLVPSQLAFTQQPTSTTFGSVINSTTGVRVAVEDANGSIVPGDSSAVTLTLNGGTFSNGQTTATASAINGIATFSNLIINSGGTFTLTASDGSYTGVTSAQFAVVGALDAWTGNGDGTSWSDPNNWSGHVVPGSGDNVSINGAAGQVINLTGVRTVNSLSTSNGLNISSGSTLAILTTAQVGGTLTLSGGTIQGGTITSGGGAGLIATSGTLNGVTLGSDLTVQGSLTVTNGLTLNNANLIVGDDSDSYYNFVSFQGTQTLGGTGQVIFAGTYGQNYLYAQGNGTLAGAAVLTIGGGVLVHGTQGGYVEGEYSYDSIINQGTINADTSGATITLSGATVTNNGTMKATSGTLMLGGNFTTASLGTVQAAGGTVSITGTLDNTGSTLALNATTGSWNLSGGTILNGTVTAAGGAVLTASSGTLNGVTLDSNLTVEGSLTVTNGLTLNNASLMIGGDSGYYYYNYGYVYFRGSQTLGGTGQVIFAGTYGGNYLYAQGNGTLAGAAVLTIGGGILVHGPQGGYVEGYYSYDSIINQGTINADTSGATITLSGATVTNNGTMQATEGGNLNVTNLVNAVGLSISGGGTLTLNGNWTNSGSLTATGSTLTIDGVWSNTGSINVPDTELNIGGTFTEASLGTLNREGGTVNITGTLDNTGNTLALNATTGSWNLIGGTILNGTVTATGGAVLTVSSGTLNGVTLGGNLTVEGSLTVTNGLTLNNANLIVGGDSGYYYYNYGYVYFQGAQTLGGTGQVIFAGTSQNYLYAQGDGTLAGAAVLTIGSGILVHGPQSGALEGYYSYDSIINQGIINADTGGATITLNGATVTNSGTMEATEGGSLNITNLVDAAGLSISGGGTLTLNGSWTNSGSLTATGSTLTLDGTWSNTGSINVPDTELNLGGTFTVASLGTLSRDGGTVNITGTLNNTGNTLALSAATGAWNLVGGTILNGTVTTTGGAVLTASSGTLNGVTLGCNLTVEGPLTITNGLTLNNANLILGDENDSYYNYVLFQGTQTLGGTGQVVFAGIYGGNYLYVQGNGTLAGAAVLTIGGGILVHGTQSGNLQGYYSYDSITNQGTIDADSASVTITVSSSNAMVTNSGTMEATAGTLNVEGTGFTNQGTVVINDGTLRLSTSFTINGQGFFDTSSDSNAQLTGNLLGTTTTVTLSNPQGTMTLNGSGTAASPQNLEAMSQDLGDVTAGFIKNFVFGTLALGNNTYVQLVDQSHNTASTLPECVYAQSVIVPAGCTLDLNGLHLYAQAVQVAGTVLHGTISQTPNAGALTLATPTPGDLSIPGELDEWTFYGRGGQSVYVLLNPGSAGSPAPLSPQLQWATVQLLDSNNNVLATVTSSTAGALISLSDIVLPADGTYKIHVNAASSDTSATGNYILGAWNVTPTVRSLNLGQSSIGSIATPFAQDQWTFSGLAGQQIQFHLPAGLASGLAFKLTGPGNYLQDTLVDATLIDLPASGTYTLTAYGVNGATGTYSFEVSQTSITALALGAPYNGTWVGSGQAQLFSVSITNPYPLSIVLADTSGSHHTELYARFGSFPTRETYDYAANGAGANHSLLVPSATVGTWYVLVYGESIPDAAGTFTLQASSSEVVLTGTSTTQSATNINTAFTLTGAGFSSGSQVSLVASNGTQCPATTVSTDLPTQMTADFAAGSVPAGNYYLKVTLVDGTSTQLPTVITIAQMGQGVLTTHLELPDPMTRHIALTLYVDYSNTGNAPMPAPLLILGATNPSGIPGALMSLNPALQNVGLWTSATPAGFSPSIQILASGATPGILQPGESGRVPVYYAGWLTTEWDFVHPYLNFSLAAIQADDTTVANWAGNEVSLNPPGISSTAWHVMYTSLLTQLGATAGGIVQLLDNNASYLGQLGENITDIGKLWSFALAQTANLWPLPSFGSTTDDSLPTPGALPLSFGRAFNQTIPGRFQSGILGLGWFTPWQMSLTVGADATVTISYGDGYQPIYQPDSRYAGAVFLPAWRP